MAPEKETYSSDTLERSNFSSFRSDLNATEIKIAINDQDSNLEPNKICPCQQNVLDNLKFDPSSVLKSTFNPCQSQHCFCQKYQLRCSNEAQTQSDFDVSNEWQNFNGKWPRHNYANKKKKVYETRSKNKRLSSQTGEKVARSKSYPCCNTLEGIPRKSNLESKRVVKNPIKRFSIEDERDEKEIAEKIEIYYFDHGNSAYYHTTDVAPILLTERLAEKSNSAATRFWAEIFGYAHIGTSFLTAFVLQFLRFVLFSLVRPLTVGIVQLVSDYFLKPILSIVFNGLVQPILILFYNIATSLRDCCKHLAAALGFFIKEVALLFRSCRFIEINNNYVKHDVDT